MGYLRVVYVFGGYVLNDYTQGVPIVRGLFNSRMSANCEKRRLLKQKMLKRRKSMSYSLE